jgi:hypothetical protein
MRLIICVCIGVLSAGRAYAGDPTLLEAWYFVLHHYEVTEQRVFINDTREVIENNEHGIVISMGKGLESPE